jgi:hypothetical protein
MRGPALFAVLAILLAAALTTTSCSATPSRGHAAGASSATVTPDKTSTVVATPAPGAPTAIRVDLLGPDTPVTPGRDGIPLVVRVTENDKPLTNALVTFEVQAGPAEFADGFEAAQTDTTGVATALSLTASRPGTVRLRVATGAYVGTVTVEVR